MKDAFCWILLFVDYEFVVVILINFLAKLETRSRKTFLVKRNFWYSINYGFILFIDEKLVILLR